MQINEIFNKITAKSPKQIIPPNPYEKSKEKTDILGVYESANEKLKPKTFVEKWRTVIGTVTTIRNAYPPISVLLDCMTAYLIANVFASGLPVMLYYVVLAVILVLVMAISGLLNKFKAIASDELFAKNATATSENEKAKSIDYVKVILLASISICISAYGGFELTKLMNDNSKSINSNYSSKTDSVKAIYNNQIAVYDNIIAQNNKVVQGKKVNKWVRLQASENLAKAQKEKGELLDKLDTKFTNLESANKSALQLDATKNNNLALYCALIVLVFEVLYVLSYKFEYWFYRRAKIENENHNFLTYESAAPVNSDLSVLVNALASVIQGNSNVLANATTTNAPATHEPKRIGFTFGQNKANTATKEEQTNVSTTHVNNAPPNLVKQPKKAKIGTIALCENCNGEYKVKTSWQRFCSDGCKLKWHEENNGFTLAKLKKK